MTDKTLDELIDSFVKDGGPSAPAYGAWEDLIEHIRLLDKSHKRLAVWLGLMIDAAECEVETTEITIGVKARDQEERFVERMKLAEDLAAATDLGASPGLLMTEDEFDD